MSVMRRRPHKGLHAEAAPNMPYWPVPLGTGRSATVRGIPESFYVPLRCVTRVTMR